MAQVPVHRSGVSRGTAAPGLARPRGGAAVSRRIGAALAGRVQVRGLLPEHRRSRECAVTSTDTVQWSLGDAVATITLNRLGGTADHRAATFAFLNREQPVFQGR